MVSLAEGHWTTSGRETRDRVATLMEAHTRITNEVQKAETTATLWRICERSACWELIDNACRADCVTQRRVAEHLKAKYANARDGYVQQAWPDLRPHSPATRNALPQPPRDLRIADRIYTFRQPLSVATYLSVAADLQMIRNEPAPTDAQPTADWIALVERSLHFEFQRLYRMLPHERDSEDEERWRMLLKYIDLACYEEANAPAEVRLGRLVRADKDQVAIAWFGGETEVFDFLDVPSELAAAEIGATIHAVLRKAEESQVRLLSISMSPVLRSDDVVVAEDAEVMRRHSIEAASPGTWPRA